LAEPGVARFWAAGPSAATRAGQPAARPAADDPRARHLRWALDQLATEHREVLLLIHRDGRTYREAAAALNVADEVMLSRLAAARRRLRALLAGADPSIYHP